jgi:hypothetical protein
MKKDIEFPKVKDVGMAIVLEGGEGRFPYLLRMVLIVSLDGYDPGKELLLKLPGLLVGQEPQLTKDNLIHSVLIHVPLCRRAERNPD